MWGRIVGVIFGFLFAGSIGVLIGLAAGTVFDNGYVSQYNRKNKHNRFVQQTYFKVAFQVMAYIAKSDGRISEDEIQTARLMMRRMQLDDRQVMQAIQYFRQGKADDFDFNEALTELYTVCHSQQVLLQMFVEMQFQSATTDGIGPEKQRLLNIMCQRLRVAPIFGGFRGNSSSQHQQKERFRQRTSSRNTAREPSSTLADDYSALGIKVNATDAEVKKAYRKLMSMNHPDKLVSQGLPEEMIKLATEKTQKIRASYERIVASRG